MPSNIDERIAFLQTIFSSPTSIEILLLFDKYKELCQKDFVEYLKHHSNKTVITTLKKLVKLGLLREYVKTKQKGNRVVKIKCYELTNVGYWYNVFLKDVRVLDKESFKRLIEEIVLLLFNKFIALKGILYENADEFLNFAVSSLLKSIMLNANKIDEPDVVVFGSTALDIYLGTKPMIFSGGSGANVASNCSKLGLKTFFVTKFFNDFLSFKLGLELLIDGVNISLSQLEEGKGTPICIVDKWYSDEPEIRCFFRDDNPPVITTVKDNVIETCNKAKAIYLGEGVCEIYLKLLEKIDLNNKILIFRPSDNMLRNYLDECKKIFQYNPLLILNNRKRNLLEINGIKVPEDLVKLGVKNIIVTRGSLGATVYVDGNAFNINGEKGVKVVDTVGAGDAFVAVLLHSLIQGHNLIKSVENACSLASQTIGIIGPRKLAHYLVSSR